MIQICARLGYGLYFGYFGQHDVNESLLRFVSMLIFHTTLSIRSRGCIIWLKFTTQTTVTYFKLPVWQAVCRGSCGKLWQWF